MRERYNALAGFFFLIAVCTLGATIIHATSIGKFDASSRVLVTAAHLKEVEGYTCVYADEESDVGIYVKDNYVANAPPEGARVSYLNSYGTVYSVSDGEFSVTPDNNEVIIPGVSGSLVYYQNVPIGFISGWDGTGHVRCIFL